jgi:hypothetical protein
MGAKKPGVQEHKCKSAKFKAPPKKECKSTNAKVSTRESANAGAKAYNKSLPSSDVIYTQRSAMLLDNVRAFHVITYVIQTDNF